MYIYIEKPLGSAQYICVYIYIYTEHSFLIRFSVVPFVGYGPLLISNSREGLKLFQD